MSPSLKRMLSGCLSPISRELRKQVQPDLTFEALRAAPEEHLDAMVLLGGEIIETRNAPQGTTIQILQKELDLSDRPLEGDRSLGRFYVVIPEFLDPAIYSRGRQLTVAGKVSGTRVEKLGDLDYVYPLISAREIHLWEKERDIAVHHIYPYTLWYGFPLYPPY